MKTAAFALRSCCGSVRSFLLLGVTLAAVTCIGGPALLDWVQGSQTDRDPFEAANTSTGDSPSVSPSHNESKAAASLLVVRRDASELPPIAPSKRSSRIHNPLLTTHEGQTIAFRDDLVRNRKVVVNFMYTVCNGICPGMTRNIKKVRDELAAQGIDDITFISISIEPDSDTPEQLSEYMENYGIENGPGLPPWIFLTGDLGEIDLLRRSLGVYDPDPIVDADRRQHGGTLTYGNDRSDWWGATPALQDPGLTVQTLIRHLQSDSRRLPGFDIQAMNQPEMGSVAVPGL